MNMEPKTAQASTTGNWSFSKKTSAEGKRHQQKESFAKQHGLLGVMLIWRTTKWHFPSSTLVRFRDFLGKIPEGLPQNLPRPSFSQTSRGSLSFPFGWRGRIRINYPPTCNLRLVEGDFSLNRIFGWAQISPRPYFPLKGLFF